MLDNRSNFATTCLLRGLLSLGGKKRGLIMERNYPRELHPRLLTTECKGISNEARSKTRCGGKVRSGCTKSLGPQLLLLVYHRCESGAAVQYCDLPVVCSRWPPDWRIDTSPNQTVSTANGSIRCNFGSFYLIRRCRKLSRNCPSVMVRDGNNY